jgi:hypothetical protein
MLPLVRTHASIIAGSAPNAAMTLMGIPSDHPDQRGLKDQHTATTRSPSGQLPQPSTLCPHGCRHPLTKEPVKVREIRLPPWTDCLKANQGKKSHKDVEATIIYHFDTNITATKAKPFPDGKQADILLSSITTIDNPAARNWHLDVTSTNPRGHQPGVDQPRRPSPPAGPRGARQTSSPAQSARRSASTPSTTPSARQQGRSCHLSRSKRRAGTVPPPLRRCTNRTCSSKSKCATRVCRRTCCWASSRRTSRSRYAGARSPK